MDIDNDSYYDGLVRHARSGNVEEAQCVLEDFANAVDAHPDRAWAGPVPLQIARYLAEAFRKILVGDDPAKALNLVGKQRGRRKGKNATHNLEALSAAYHFLIRSGLKPELAKTELNENIGADRATIHRARKQHPVPKDVSLNDPILDERNEILRVMLKPYGKQVSSILKSWRMNSSKSRIKR